MKTAENTPAQPPETLEGWYAQHQIFTVDRASLAARNDRLAEVTPHRVESTQQDSGAGGWTTWVQLIGSKSDLMYMRFLPSLDDIGSAECAFRRSSLIDVLHLESSFLSVTEAGLYHLTAQVARETAERGGTVGDEAYAEELTRRIAKERESSFVQKRLYPTLPANMPYVCFYPMSKRREPSQNWYELPLDERSRLMHTHGMTGRRYAGRVLQIITGAIGLDAWEWGVTLFAKDPLDFKKLVTDMRFDEVSAQYAEFGDFYVGRRIEAETLKEAIETII